MNVTIGSVAAQFLFSEYFIRIFSIMSLQCRSRSKERKTTRDEYILQSRHALNIQSRFLPFVFQFVFLQLKERRSTFYVKIYFNLHVVQWRIANILIFLGGLTRASKIVLKVLKTGLKKRTIYSFFSYLTFISNCVIFRNSVLFPPNIYSALVFCPQGWKWIQQDTFRMKSYFKHIQARCFYEMRAPDHTLFYIFKEY